MELRNRTLNPQTSKLNKYIYRNKKPKTTPSQSIESVRMVSFSLPNHEKLSSQLLMDVVSLNFQTKTDKKLEPQDLYVNVLDKNPPNFEGAIWTSMVNNIYRVNLTLDKVIELSNYRNISKITYVKD